MLRTICLLTLIALLGGLNSGADAGDQEPDGIWPTFSVELRPIPFEERERGLALMAELQDKGYLAHAHQFDTDGESWLIVEVGAFADRNAAAAFSHSFRAIEGRRGSVVQGHARIIPADGQRDFVVTPTALWVRDGGGPREVYAFGAESRFWKDLPQVMLAQLSPDGKSLAFIYDRRVHVASLDSSETRTLTDGQSPQISPVGDYPWQPNWSPSGDHLVFLDLAFFGQPTSLWTIQADGGGLRCLSCSVDGDQAVRWFLWHPTEDRLLFVRTARLRAVGGELLSADMDGTVSPVAAAALGEFEEFVGPLSVEDGQLHLKRLRSADALYSDHTTISETLPVGAL